jgi:hypothetical protein
VLPLHEVTGIVTDADPASVPVGDLVAAGALLMS